MNAIIRKSAIGLVTMFVAAGTVAACADKDTLNPLVGPETPANGNTLFLGVSNLTPAAGDEVIVTVNAARAAGESAVGSFKVRISHAPGAFQFIAALPQSDGMVIANPVNDTLIIVGASGEGFTSAALASVRMKVADPSQMASLALEIVGITSTDFANEAASTSVDRRLFRGTITSR